MRRMQKMSYIRVAYTCGGMIFRFSYLSNEYGLDGWEANETFEVPKSQSVVMMQLGRYSVQRRSDLGLSVELHKMEMLVSRKSTMTRTMLEVIAVI